MQIIWNRAYFWYFNYRGRRKIQKIWVYTNLKHAYKNIDQTFNCCNFTQYSNHTRVNIGWTFNSSNLTQYSNQYFFTAKVSHNQNSMQKMWNQEVCKMFPKAIKNEKIQHSNQYKSFENKSITKKPWHAKLMNRV